MTLSNILFLCPHGAAKSVLAMTYFDHLATKAGLNMTVSNAGTEPDPIVDPGVEAYLKDEGFKISGLVPSLLTAAAQDSADIIVSIGCISPEKVSPETRFLDWSDVPMLSDGFQEARNKIYDHVVALVEGLATEMAAG